MNKFRDILKESVLWTRLDLIIKDSQNKYLRSLGKNDFSHSEKIEQILDRLIPDVIKNNDQYFDHGDIFLLLSSVYLHDIGRTKKNTDHEIESGKMIISNPNEYHLEVHQASAISQIVSSHASEEKWPIRNNDKNFGLIDITNTGKTYDLQVLGALLRLADELDNTFVRTRGLPDQNGNIRHLIRDVNPVIEKGIIEIHASPSTWREYSELNKIKSDTEKRLREIQPFLERIKLPYYQICMPGLENFSAPLNIAMSSEELLNLSCKLLSILGTDSYDIDPESTINGRPFPIVLKLKVFSSNLLIAVIPVTVDEINTKIIEYIGALSFLLINRHINDGWIICYTTCSEKIKNLCTESGIKLFLYEDIINNNYKFKKNINNNIDVFEKEEVFTKKIFIVPKGREDDIKKIDDLIKYIRIWINSNNGMQLTILGDYGVGKTTIINKIAYDISKELLKGKTKNKRIPIVIRLKEYINNISLEDNITLLFVNKLNIRIDYKTFQEFNKEGLFVFFLDGFDEIPGIYEAEEAVKIFRELDKLVEIKSKVILTCRTHFFLNKNHLNEFLTKSRLYQQVQDKYGYRIIYIDGFERKQVEKYIEKWDSDKKENYLSIIDKVYNLEDLSRRPVLLNILMKTIPQLEIKNESSINSSSLYRTYVNFWLKRDEGRTSLSYYDRKLLSQLIANYYFINEISEAHYLTLNDHFTPSKLSIKYNQILLDYELRTCNFLKRDNEGNYSFVHNSFHEYLLATIMSDYFFNRLDERIKFSWFLPSEKKTKNKNSLFSSIEVESFFIMICQEELNLNSDIYEMVFKRDDDKRIQSLTLLLIDKINLPHSSKFLMKMLLTNKWANNIEYIVNKIIQAEDFDKAIDFFISNTKKYYDVTFFSYILFLFKHYASEEQQNSIATLNSQINKRKEKQRYKDFEEFYPYSNIAYQKALFEYINNSDMKDTIDNIKKDFDLIWKREKAEYDKIIDE